MVTEAITSEAVASPAEDAAIERARHHLADLSDADLSSMTDERLLALANRVADELEARGLDG